MRFMCDIRIIYKDDVAGEKNGYVRFVLCVVPTAHEVAVCIAPI